MPPKAAVRLFNKGITSRFASSTPAMISASPLLARVSPALTTVANAALGGVAQFHSSVDVISFHDFFDLIHEPFPSMLYLKKRKMTRSTAIAATINETHPTGIIQNHLQQKMPILAISLLLISAKTRQSCFVKTL